MKSKPALSAISLVVAILVMGTVSPVIAGDDVEICHKGDTKLVSEKSAKKHLAKHRSDTKGSCPDPPVPELGTIVQCLCKGDIVISFCEPNQDIICGATTDAFCKEKCTGLGLRYEDVASCQENVCELA